MCRPHFLRPRPFGFFTGGGGGGACSSSSCCATSCSVTAASGSPSAPAFAATTATLRLRAWFERRDRQTAVKWRPQTCKMVGSARSARSSAVSHAASSSRSTAVRVLFVKHEVNEISQMNERNEGGEQTVSRLQPGAARRSARGTAPSTPLCRRSPRGMRWSGASACWG